MMKISIQEIVQKAADEALDNATINNVPFREWIDNVNNAYEIKMQSDFLPTQRRW